MNPFGFDIRPKQYIFIEMIVQTATGGSIRDNSARAHRVQTYDGLLVDEHNLQIFGILRAALGPVGERETSSAPAVVAVRGVRAELLAVSPLQTFVPVDASGVVGCQLVAIFAVARTSIWRCSAFVLALECCARRTRASSLFIRTIFAVSFAVT